IRDAAAPEPVAAGSPDLTVRLLGPVEVHRDRENPIPSRAWTIKRALTIFCYLAVSRDRRASKERIVDALWGDTRLAVIEKNFHPTISFLRRALNHGHKVPRHFILYERGAYRLNPAYRYAIDTEEFESGLKEARRLAQAGDAAAALAGYDAALALYRGPFLEEEYDEWAEAPRARFESLHRAALRDAGRLHLESGSADAGLALLAQAVALDPLDEEASAELMLGQGRCGHRAEVEKEFERLRKELREEDSGPPSPAAQQAHERALRLASEGRKVIPMPRARGGGSPGRREE
ncbi:MAG TPA: BTAD domain-containing putative transcriptional regulator, partial [Candidatus Polarisedimenticolia bacterium]|nr:BTAD domain-containing putative transcriptional regulator [Candidatus Polarisedimenticolia bacterium]